MSDRRLVLENGSEGEVERGGEQEKDDEPIEQDDLDSDDSESDGGAEGRKERRKKRESEWVARKMKGINRMEFLCKWRGLSYDDCTWERAEDINNDFEIERFYRYT